MRALLRQKGLLQSIASLQGNEHQGRREPALFLCEEQARGRRSGRREGHRYHVTVAPLAPAYKPSLNSVKMRSKTRLNDGSLTLVPLEYKAVLKWRIIKSVSNTVCGVSCSGQRAGTADSGAVRVAPPPLGCGAARAQAPPRPRRVRPSRSLISV